MPAAQTKAEIIATTEQEWSKLATLLDQITPEQAMVEQKDGTTIKDLIAHRAHWIDLFLGWFDDGQAGRAVHIPAKGYKWSQLTAYNRELRRRQAGLGWATARAELGAAHGRLLAFYQAQGNADLYGAPMVGGNGKWTAGRYSESAGASHYRSAGKYMRQYLRAAGA